MSEMKSRDVRAFVDRGWDEKDRLKWSYWAERRRSEGPDAMLAASSALRDHLRVVRPDWPTEKDRAEDLRHHLALIEKLGRVANAFTDH